MDARLCTAQPWVGTWLRCSCCSRCATQPGGLACLCIAGPGCPQHRAGGADMPPALATSMVSCPGPVARVGGTAGVAVGQAWAALCGL